MRHRIRLRPATDDDVPLMDRWWREEAGGGGFDDFGTSFERAPVPYELGKAIVELDDGTPIGDVSWHAVQYGPNAESQAWNIGIRLVPEHRGSGHGTEAQRLLAEHLFATTPRERVEASTDVDNLPEQRALEKAGFTREGILRHAQFRGGEWRDLVSYSRLRGDPAPPASGGDEVGR